jgi:hypothetical protein
MTLRMSEGGKTEGGVEGGIFALRRGRRVLFCKRVRFRLSDLRHRESRVTITERMLTGEGRLGERRDDTST